jgi:hypothetical protein
VNDVLGLDVNDILGLDVNDVWYFLPKRMLDYGGKSGCDGKIVPLPLA